VKAVYFVTMSVDIKLGRVDRVYKAGEKLTGAVVVTSKGSMSHSGITLQLHGEVNLQLSAKSVGMFEAFYNSLKPVQLIQYTVEIAKSGKLPNGVTELPFEFQLDPPESSPGLFETYHGVFVNVQYSIQVDIQRTFLQKNLTKKIEFILHGEPSKEIKEVPVPFTITPDSLENVRKVL